MKKYNKIFQLLIFTFIFSFMLNNDLWSVPHNKQNQNIYFKITDGKIVEYKASLSRMLNISGHIVHLDFNSEKIYYLKKDSSAVYYAGCYSLSEGRVLSEVKIFLADSSLVEQVKGFNDHLYLFCVNRIKKIKNIENIENRSSSENNLVKEISYVIKGKFIYRVDLNSNTIEKFKNYSDAILTNGQILFLKNQNGKYYLHYNGKSCLVSISGVPGFKTIVNNRIATLQGKNGYELFDLKSLKSIYQYSDRSYPALPGKYNLSINILDTRVSAIHSKNGNIFYKIYINGIEEGRTSTGVSGVNQNFTLMVASGKYHVLEFERYELDKIKKRYKRANNVYQPDPVKVFIPENRVIILNTIYDGRVYSTKTSIEMNSFSIDNKNSILEERVEE